MPRNSLVELTKCRWREFRREPSAFYWVIFMPILWMVVLGVAFSNPKPERYGVGLIDGTELGPTILTKLKESPQIKLRSGDKDNILTLFKRGDIVVALTNEESSVIYQFDKANPESVRARSYLDNLIQTASGRTNPTLTEDREIKSDGGRYVDFLIPGLLGFSIMSSSLFGIGMTIVSNRKENLLKRYLATPMSKYEFLTSHVFGRIMVLFFEFTAIMVTGYFLFGFGVYGNFAAFVALTIIGAACFTAMALLCAARTSSIPVIAAMINVITIPMMLLSGVFFSKNNFPDWMHGAINYLPLTALNDGLRKVALEGLSFGAIGFELTILAVTTVVCIVAARSCFKWY